MDDAFTHLKQWLENFKDIFRILKINEKDHDMINR